jgi:hypothetical protein
MELHPCECGVPSFEQRHWLEERGDELLAIYEGPCRGCKKVRRFELTLIDDLPPAPPAFGGPEPSQLIDPGEFLAAAERTAEQVPADVATRPPHERTSAKKELGVAIAAIEEVLKFIPEGEERVPATCFNGTRPIYDRDPARFERASLVEQIAGYRRRLTGL